MDKYDRYAEYQTPCLERLRAARENGNRGLIVMAGGLGKTIVAARDVKTFLDENPGKRVLFLCHDTGILAQNKKKFESIVGDSYRYGLFIGHDQKEFDVVDVLFASFQTMGGPDKWMHAFLENEFAYVIVDEAHHAAAQTFKAVIDYFRPEFLLGLTATPNREDGKSLSDVFGEPIFTLDFVDAWAMGYLTGVDYQLVTDEISGLKEYLDPENHERISLGELNRKVFIPKRDEWLVKDIQVRTAAKKNPRMVVFCQAIRHAEHIAELLGSRVLHSKQTLMEQEQNLSAFRKGVITTLVVVDKLNEGIDVPEIDVIVRLRLTGSATVFQQQLCRGLRICDGKEDVLVLDYVSSCEQIEMLFDMERELQEHSSSHSSRELGSEPRFVVTVTGGSFHAEKVDIMELIQRAKWGKYSPRVLTHMLQAFAKKLGRTPDYKDMKAAEDIPSMNTYAKYFGTWNKALEAAGLEANLRRWGTDEEILEMLRSLAEELGRTPEHNDLQADVDMPNAEVYVHRFGTWNNALRAAGLKVVHHRGRSNQDMIEALQALAKKLGRIPSYNDARTASSEDSSMPSCCTYTRRFGSWDEALKAAKLKTKDETPESDAELLRKLQALARKLNRTPSMRACNASEDTPNGHLYAKRFGSWNKALEAAGLEPNLVR